MNALIHYIYNWKQRPLLPHFRLKETETFAGKTRERWGKMAVVLVLAGSFLGLLSALVSLIFLGFGILSALALWSGVGIACTLLGVFCTLLAEARPMRDDRSPTVPARAG